MKKMVSYLAPYRRECILGPLFKLLEAAFELLVPLVVARIVDVGVGSRDTGYITRMCLMMAALGVVGLICSVTAQYFAARAAVGFAGQLRHGVMERILGLSYSKLDALGTSTMVTRMTSDVNQVQNGVNLTLRLLLRSPFVVLGAMGMAFTIDTRAALVFAGIIPVLCVVVFGIMGITMPMYRKVQGRLDGLTSSARQNLTGVRVLRAFSREEAETADFQRRNRELTTSQLGAGRISGLMNPLTFVLINLAVIVLVQVGALQVDSGVLTQGQVIALYNYMSQILVELIKMANLIITMTKAAACARRIQGILELSAEDASAGEVPAFSGGSVEFRNVTAQYDGAGEPALENITFSAAPGETVGIIGGTGAGKTTLVNLIPGFYSPQSGQVLVDGVEVAQFRKEALRQRIGVVPQRAELFRGTIRENLLWGNPDATDAQLLEALEIAQALDVAAGKGGLDALVEQGGANLSGGQRQRLTIARALVRKPEILILDDSASALDYATDAALRQSIGGMENPPTTLIISQRAASVRHADRILVLDDGVVAGCGTHDALLESCEAYQEIYYSQFGKEAAGYAV